VTTREDGRARRIASEWYGGAAYRFVSTGTIDDAVRADIRQSLVEVARSYADTYPGTVGYEREAVTELLDLVEYLDTREDRGPVDGWSDIWEDETEETE